MGYYAYRIFNLFKIRFQRDCVKENGKIIRESSSLGLKNSNCNINVNNN